MRLWTYKNADEKAHTFSRRSKNVKKRMKTYKKRILCKFTFTVHSTVTMGAYLPTPITTKKSEDFDSEKFTCGLSGMQGWRTNMEVSINFFQA